MLNEQSNERVLFSGYAKLPVGITAAEMYKVIGVIVVVDMKSGLIVKADCTLATELARQFMTNTAVLKTGKAPKAVTNLSEDNKITKMYKKNV